MASKRKLPYRIIGAYDSETTNIDLDGRHVAFPVLHQLGLCDCPVEDLDSSNVENHVTVNLFRHTIDLYQALDDIASGEYDYVPVICCHNLSFDMYGLAQWLMSHDVRVLAKSKRKPITFTIQNDAGEPCLVIWDTLIFSQQGLARMGADCGYTKAVGEWDYNLIRTPETDLTPAEIDYSKRDIYALLAWLGWWLRRNPDIEPQKLGLNVVTKTGVVRERRRVRFDQLKGKCAKYNVGRHWLYINRANAPADNDELNTMFAATRGGFTFCSSANASIPYDLVDTGYCVAGYDATSQHPAQMVSHRYPVGFHKTSPVALMSAFNTISYITYQDVLQNWSKPFPVAFYGCFRFCNLRPKDKSIWADWGVLPLASARFSKQVDLEDEDAEQTRQYEQNMKDSGYTDTAVNPVFAFGKLVSADDACIYLTELSAWEVSQCYDYDSCSAVAGYITSKFVRPSDMAVISVMQFYQAKNFFKRAQEHYKVYGTITNGNDLRKVKIPESIVSALESGTLSDSDVKATYLALKADLNALFGIEASNEYRRDTVLTESGIDFTGDFGVCNKPKNPKAWYQFGQRIVGWSRVAQVCVMLLASPYVKTIINGDTDSVKFLVERSKLSLLSEALEELGIAVDAGKHDNCARIKHQFPAMYDDLLNIGHYVLEFTSDRFCASWNKAYCTHEINARTGKREFNFTLAGIPASRGVNAYANALYDLTGDFGTVCDLMLGYNVTFAYDLIELNGRFFPEWGNTISMRVIDYKGKTSRVAEPAALALFPMSKTINSLDVQANRSNYEIALQNRSSVNSDYRVLYWRGNNPAQMLIGEYYG